MLTKVVFCTLSFFVNVIIAASAETCAKGSMDPDVQYQGMQISLTSAPLHGNMDNIPEQLFNETYRRITNDDNISFEMTTEMGFNFNITDSDTPYNGQLHGIPITLSNFYAVYNGIFIPPLTGDYTFTIDEVSDGAAIYVYDNRDIYCCEDMNFPAWLNKSSQLVYIPTDPNYQTNSLTVHLEADLQYLFFLSYANYGGDAIFQPSFTFPSGQVHTNLADYSYGHIKSFSCGTGNITSTILSLGTQAYTTTFSTTVITTEGTGLGGLPYTEIQTIYYVLTPASSPSSSSSTSELITSLAVSSSSYKSSTTVSASSETPSGTSSDSVTSSSLSSSSGSSTSHESYITSTFITSQIVSSISNMTVVSSTDSVGETSFTILSSTSIFSDDVFSNSSFSPSSVTNSFTRSTLSNMEGDSTTGTSEESRTFDSFESITSGNMGFSNSSFTKTFIKSTTKSLSNRLTQSTSCSDTTSSKHYQDANPAKSEDYLTTSTYTDVYGMTRTTTVRCSTQSNDINPTGESHLPDVTVVTVTSCSNKKCETVVSIVARPTDLAKTTVTGKVNPQETATSSGFSGASSVASVASVAVQLQSSRGSSSATHTVQQAPNAAGKYTVGLLFAIVPIAFPLLFI